MIASMILSGLLPLLLGAGLLYYVVKILPAITSTAGASAARPSDARSVAARLGLALAQGDPTLDLAMAFAYPSKNGFAVRMTGSRHELPVEFVCSKRVESDAWSGTRTTTYQARFTVCARAAFPPFELRSARSPCGTIAPRMPLPAMKTGDPAVDGGYLIATQSPQMASLLARMLAQYQSVAPIGIHVIGDGQAISFCMEPRQSPLVSAGVYLAEEITHALVETARAVGG